MRRARCFMAPGAVGLAFSVGSSLAMPSEAGISRPCREDTPAEELGMGDDPPRDAADPRPCLGCGAGTPASPEKTPRLGSPATQDTPGLTVYPEKATRCQGGTRRCWEADTTSV